MARSFAVHATPGTVSAVSFVVRWRRCRKYYSRASLWAVATLQHWAADDVISWGHLKLGKIQIVNFSQGEADIVHQERTQPEANGRRLMQKQSGRKWGPLSVTRVLFSIDASIFCAARCQI